jgi:hypothetical protein
MEISADICTFNALVAGDFFIRVVDLHNAGGAVQEWELGPRGLAAPFRHNINGGRHYDVVFQPGERVIRIRR